MKWVGTNRIWLRPIPEGNNIYTAYDLRAHVRLCDTCQRFMSGKMLEMIEKAYDLAATLEEEWWSKDSDLPADYVQRCNFNRRRLNVGYRAVMRTHEAERVARPQIYEICE